MHNVSNVTYTGVDFTKVLLGAFVHTNPKAQNGTDVVTDFLHFRDLRFE